MSKLLHHLVCSAFWQILPKFFFKLKIEIENCYSELDGLWSREDGVTWDPIQFKDPVLNSWSFIVGSQGNLQLGGPVLTCVVGVSLRLMNEWCVYNSLENFSHSSMSAVCMVKDRKSIRFNEVKRKSEHLFDVMITLYFISLFFSVLLLHQRKVSHSKMTISVWNQKSRALKFWEHKICSNK